MVRAFAFSVQKGEPWRLWAAVAIVFAFAFLGLSALGAAWTFPHRYAPGATDFDTAFMGTLAANDIAPLGTAWLDSNDEMYGTTPIAVHAIGRYNLALNQPDSVANNTFEFPHEVELLGIQPLDEHVQAAAAGQSDFPGGFVGHPKVQ